MNKQVGIIAGAVLVLILLVAGVAIAVGGGDDDSEETTDTTTTSTTVVTSDGGGSNGGGGGSGGGGGGGPTGPQPVVVSFGTLSGNSDVDCHNGNQQNFSATWDTTDAQYVSISGGGSNLPADGQTSLSFDCLTAPHTYTLTAYGSGGKTATASLTLPARNVQSQGGEEDEDEGP